MQRILGTVRTHSRLIYAALPLGAAAVVGRANATAAPGAASLPKAFVGYLVIAALAFAAGLAFFNVIRNMRSPRPKVFAFYIIAVGAGILLLFAGSLASSGYSNSSFAFFLAAGLYVPLLMHANRL